MEWIFRPSWLKLIYLGDTVYLDKLEARPLTWPTVWSSKGKHAHYRSISDCENGGVFFGVVETCNQGVVSAFGRFNVWESHNIGGAHDPTIDCISSGWFPNGPEECFWTGELFSGWSVQEGTTPFHVFLNSIVYGCILISASNYYCSQWGL